MTVVTRRFLVMLRANGINLLRHEDEPFITLRIASSEIDSQDALISAGDIVDLTWDDEAEPLRYDSMRKVS